MQPQSKARARARAAAEFERMLAEPLPERAELRDEAFRILRAMARNSTVNAVARVQAVKLIIDDTAPEKGQETAGEEGIPSLEDAFGGPKPANAA